MFSFLKIINLLFFYIRQYIGIILSFLAFYLIRKNLKLIDEKQELENKLNENIEANKTQEKVIETIIKTKDVDIKSNIDRMRNGKL